MRRLLSSVSAALVLLVAPAAAHAQVPIGNQSSQVPNPYNIAPGQEPAASNGAVLPGAPGPVAPVFFGSTPDTPQSSFTTSIAFAQANNTPFASDTTPVQR